jgi:omega-amidase
VQDLKVGLVQTTLSWEQADINRTHFEQLVEESNIDCDLLVLPEMFTTGFSMDSQRLAEDCEGDTLAWMQQLAARHDVAVTGSFAARDGEKIFNRLLFVTPDGATDSYDKKHLFRMSGEHNHYAPGDIRIVVEWRGWRICPMICYDLRFPVWSRERDDYDLLLYVANWPAKRAMHWRQLLIARAIENQSYCIGLNRIGEDGNNIVYSGDSLAIAADGIILLDCEDRDGVFECSLSAEAKETYRRKFPSHMDRDSFQMGTDPNKKGQT